MTARLTVPDLLPRIRRARQAVEDARAVLAAEAELRDSLIVTAVDAGITQKAAAEAAGLTRTRVNAILGNAPIHDVI